MEQGGFALRRSLSDSSLPSTHVPSPGPRSPSVHGLLASGSMEDLHGMGTGDGEGGAGEGLAAAEGGGAEPSSSAAAAAAVGAGAWKGGGEDDNDSEASTKASLAAVAARLSTEEHSRQSRDRSGILPTIRTSTDMGGGSLSSFALAAPYGGTAYPPSASTLSETSDLYATPRMDDALMSPVQLGGLPASHAVTLTPQSSMQLAGSEGVLSHFVPLSPALSASSLVSVGEAAEEAEASAAAAAAAGRGNEGTGPLAALVDGAPVEGDCSGNSNSSRAAAAASPAALPLDARPSAPSSRHQQLQQLPHSPTDAEITPRPIDSLGGLARFFSLVRATPPTPHHTRTHTHHHTHAHMRPAAGHAYTSPFSLA